MRNRLLRIRFLCESSVRVVVHAGVQTGRETVEHSDTSSQTSGDTHTFTYILIGLYLCCVVQMRRVSLVMWGW